MRIIKPLNIGCLNSPYIQNGQFRLSVGAALMFDLQRPDELLSEQELWQVVPGELGEDLVFDEGRPKARGEVLVVGSCYAPEGKPVTRTTVGFSVGQWWHELAVTGARVWLSRGSGLFSPSEPEPFTVMRLGPEASLGGEGYPGNEKGIGFLPQGKQPDMTAGSPLPCVEDPGQSMKDPWDQPPMAGLWPISPRHPSRAALFGTPDARWVKNIFPENPRDTRPHFYNQAPPKQQLKQGFFAGDEALTLKNLHPSASRFESRLPGYRARCFALLKGLAGVPEFREVPLAAETVWLLPDKDRGVLIFRGSTQIQTLAAREVDALVLGYEKIGGEVRPPGAYRAALDRRTGTAASMAAMVDMTDLSPPEVAQLELARQKAAEAVAAEKPSTPPRRPPEVESALADAQQKSQRELARARSAAQAAGIDLDAELDRQFDEEMAPFKEELDQLLPLLSDIGVEVDIDAYRPTRAAEQFPSPETNIQVPPVNSLADAGPAIVFAEQMAAKLKTLHQLAESIGKKMEALGQGKQDSAEADARALAKEMGIDYDAKLAELQSQPPPDPFQVMAQAAEAAQADPALAAQMASAQAQAQASRGDIEKGMSMAGGGFNPALDPELKPMMRQAAHHLPPPDQKPAIEAEAQQAQVHAAASSGEGLANADLSGANLAGVNLTGQDLSGAVLTGAHLSGADLSGADLTGAILAHADLSGAVLAGATLKEASLGKAKLKGADLSGVDLSQSIISGADFTRANLAGANLEEIDLVHETSFVEADLTGAVMTGLTLLECDLSGANLQESNLEGSILLTCKLQNTDLSRANLSRAVLSGAQAAGCKMVGAAAANLSAPQESDLSGADLSGADLTDGNLREVNLQGATLRGAILERADLSGAGCQGADLSRVMAHGARMDYASLAGANLSKADLMGASVMGADLTRADLRGAHLYDTNALFAQAQGADLRGASITRCKLGEHQGRRG